MEENKDFDETDFIIPELIMEEEMIEDIDQQNALVKANFPKNIYLLPTESKPVFPGMIFPMIFQTEKDTDFINYITQNVPEQIVGFILMKEEKDEDSVRFYKIGTIARILKVKMNDEGIVQVLMRSESRFKIISATKKNERYEAVVDYPEDIVEPNDSEELKALGLAVLSTIRELMKLNSLFSEEMKMLLTRVDISAPGRLADFAAMTISASREDLQDILEQLNVKNRLSKILFLLRQELDINKLKENITKQIEERISKQQREFFLREQLKVIKQELGLEKEEKDDEIDKFQERISKLQVTEEVQKKMNEELNKLKFIPSQSPEYNVCLSYLDWLTSLPWNTQTTDSINIDKSRKILDRDHYGLEDVKTRIIEHLCVGKLKGKIDGSILCFVGPPGVGKTSIGKCIAEALGRKFFRFSLGGMRDEAEIKGHRRTYVGAMPGKFLQAINTCGTRNPVIMLDEIDKVGSSFQGDPASALLEVLDPEQNSSFRDHYLDVPFDLSNVLFIATANVLDTIPAPLLDRMEIIRLSGYIMEEKLAIAKKYLVPKLLQKNGIDRKQLKFAGSSLQFIIEQYAREAGVRNLEKNINSCVRKVAALIAENKVDKTYSITPQKLLKLLGNPIFEDDPLMQYAIPGVVMGLAWTAYGGSTLYVETIGIQGKDSFKITGQVGGVMNESSQIAYSYVLANAEKFGVELEQFKTQTLHIHIPAGATPKDGPSAGVTLATSIISYLRNKPLPAKIAMTGELTLTGRVLPVGGIKEKVIAAIRSGVEVIILPKLNEKDFNEIPEKIRKSITPKFAMYYDEVFEIIK